MMEERYSENPNEVPRSHVVGSRGFGHGTSVDVNRRKSHNSPFFRMIGSVIRTLICAHAASSSSFCKYKIAFLYTNIYSVVTKHNL